MVTKSGTHYMADTVSGTGDTVTDLVETGLWTRVTDVHWNPDGKAMQSEMDSSSRENGEGKGNPLQYSCLERPMDGGAWWDAVHGVTKSRTPLSDFTFTFHFPALEKEMATHSSVLTRRIPGMAEPGGLPSMGSHRVCHDWSDLAAAAAAVRKGRIMKK